MESFVNHYADLAVGHPSHKFGSIYCFLFNIVNSCLQCLAVLSMWEAMILS